MMGKELVFIAASEKELNELLSGRLIGQPVPWNDRYKLKIKSSGTFGVVALISSDDTNFAQPVALVIPESAQRRLFGRLASLREELAPLSAWCHLLSENEFEMAEDVVRSAHLNGFEASWSGLCIAEASLLADRSIDKIRVAACFATVSFAVARAQSLWPRVSVLDTLDLYEAANRLTRSSASGASKLSARLHPIWSSLIDAHDGVRSSSQGLSDALLVLKHCRQHAYEDELYHLSNALEKWPERALLRKLPDMSVEARVQAFDHLIAEMRVSGNLSERMSILAFVAGYLATIAAGGASSLSLAANVSREFPEIMAWAFVIGGVGEKVVWTSSFGGLGRLVSRELARPFHLDEPPNADFAIDEAMHLVDRQLSDPLVHLKIKQLRYVTVALFPGVNITIPMGEQGEIQPGYDARASSRSADSNDVSALVEAIWPELKRKLRSEGYRSSPKAKTSSSKRKDDQGGLL